MLQPTWDNCHLILINARDPRPWVICLFSYEDFWKMIFWLVLKLEISYNRVIISWRILVFFRGFFWRLYFCMVKYLSFHNSSFAFNIHFNVNGKATVWHPPLFTPWKTLQHATKPPVPTQWLCTNFIKLVVLGVPQTSLDLLKMIQTLNPKPNDDEKQQKSPHPSPLFKVSIIKLSYLWALVWASSRHLLLNLWFLLVTRRKEGPEIEKFFLGEIPKLRNIMIEQQMMTNSHPPGLRKA